MTRIFRRRALSLLVLLAVVGGMGSGVVQADDGPYPGLPPAEAGLPPGVPDGLTMASVWAGNAQGGVARANRIRQWMRVPMQIAATNVRLVAQPNPPDAPELASRVFTRNLLYFVSPAKASHAYGMTPEMPVRTVAFGAVPVEATIQLSQRRGADGQLVPIVVETTDGLYRQGPHRPGERLYSDTDVRDRFELRITSLKVDGVPIALRDACRTSMLASLTLHGEGAWQGDPNLVGARPFESGHFIPANGGLLTGTIDVPSFSSCRSRSGDDLAPLLTATVSGAGNAIRVQTGSPGCRTNVPGSGAMPPAPGATDPVSANCPDNAPPKTTSVPPLPEIPTTEE